MVRAGWIVVCADATMPQPKIDAIHANGGMTRLRATHQMGHPSAFRLVEIMDADLSSSVFIPTPVPKAVDYDHSR
jgi:hypothetical protein